MNLSISRGGTIIVEETNIISSEDSAISYINCFLEADEINNISITKNYFVAENFYEI